MPHKCHSAQAVQAKRASARRLLVIGRLLLVGSLLLSTLIDARLAIAATPLGANKFDLLLQYEGYNDFTDRSDAYRRVTRAMARKAIFDAKDAGFSFLRVSVAGYGGTGPKSAQRDMLTLWQSDPATYWRRVEEMLDDLDRADMRIVPTLLWHYAQFPALTGETTTDFIRNPGSASRGLAARYIQDFVTRYRARKTILFYELTNEFNLHAGMDVHRHCLDKQHDPARCASIGNYTQDDLNNFAHDMMQLLHRLDPSHQVSSGYAVPPPWAYHMAMSPEWNKRGGFASDSREEFASNLTTIHRDYDIVSIHVYPHENAVRFGRPPGSQADMISDAATVAHSLHKKLFLGEFGDASGASPFMRNVKALLDADTVDYAAIWVWEFYQTSTFESFNTEAAVFSIEPGFRDDVIALLRRSPLTPDSSPRPRVVLTWPLPCSHISQPVQIAAVASDGDRPVSDVEFQVDGTSIGTVTTPPYRLTWDSAGKPAHTAHLKVIARAAQSNSTATDSGDVLLNGESEACKVSID
jgi:Bacterial Ig domain/Cellulase (glycosyl hydrolase family 5)